MKKSIAAAFAAVFFIGAIILVILSKPVILIAGDPSATPGASVPPSPSAVTSPSETPGPSPSASPAASPSPTPVDTAPKEFARGFIEDNVYTNEYAGLTFTAPGGWAYVADDKMADMFGIDADTIRKEGKDPHREGLSEMIIFDMLARNPATGSNVMVGYEDLTKRIGNTECTEEQYIEETQYIFIKLQPITGYRFESMTEQKIGSSTFILRPAMMAEVNGSQYYFMRKVDNYMLLIIVTVFGGDDVSAIIANFS